MTIHQCSCVAYGDCWDGDEPCGPLGAGEMVMLPAACIFSISAESVWGASAPGRWLRTLARVVGAAAVAVVLLLSPVASRAETLGPAIGASGFVYTANEDAGSISVIDLATGLVRTVGLKIAPHNVQVSADGTRLFVVGMPEMQRDNAGGMTMPMPGMQGQLLVFGTDALDAGPVATIQVGAHPAHVIADRDGKLAFVTDAETDAVIVVDLSARRVIGKVTTGKYPHGLRMSPDGREIYVADVEDGTVAVLDVQTRTSVARIPVGAGPVQVGFTPDGARVFVSLRDDNAVAAIDTRTRAVIARYDVGRGPIQVQVTPDGRYVYVCNQGTSDDPGDTVSVIDVASGAVIATIHTGRGAHGVAASADGALMFVTNSVDSTLSVIDTRTYAVVASYAVGAGPNGVTFRPAKN